MPKKRPTATATPKARSDRVRLDDRLDADDLEAAADEAGDDARARRRGSRAARPRRGTGRGCRPRRAPIALRMPISRVRSVTVTSMMFMTPIPPTSSEIAATAAEQHGERGCVELVVCEQRRLVEDAEVGRAVVGDVCAASRIVGRPRSAASSTAPSDFASTTIWRERRREPARVSCTVVSGAITMSSWSWKPFEPFDLSTPTTVEVAPLS